jgi:hypothetical protein
MLPNALECLGNPILITTDGAPIWVRHTFCQRER